MQTSIKRRFLAYGLAVAVLIGASVYRPQRADAVALSTSAGVAAVVSAVMAGCGVSYWANTQQDAVDYIGGKIDDYLTSIGGAYSDALEWLGANAVSDIFTIASRGALGVSQVAANKILDFVSWLFTENDIVSGGNAVTTGGLSIARINHYSPNGYQGSMSSYFSDGILTVVCDRYGGYNYSYTLLIPKKISTGETVEITALSNTMDEAMYWESGLTNDIETNIAVNTSYLNAFTIGSGTGAGRVITADIDYNYIFIAISARRNLPSGQLTVGISGVSTDYNTVITPSNNVVVPPALEQGQNLIVTTTAPFAADATKDAAMQSILDTVVSQDGLSAETEASEGITSGWTWLYDIISGIGDTLTDIKNAVLGIPSTIVGGISTALQAAFVPSQAYIDSFVASLYSTFDNHFSILSYPFSLLGTFITKVATIGSSEPIFTWGNIYEPFSGKLLIAAGSYNLNTALQNQAFAYAHTIYMIVIKGLLSFQFVSFLYAWFCDVFHMKNSDFDSPFDEDGEEE